MSQFLHCPLLAVFPRQSHEHCNKHIRRPVTNSASLLPLPRPPPPNSPGEGLGLWRDVRTEPLAATDDCPSVCPPLGSDRFQAPGHPVMTTPLLTPPNSTPPTSLIQAGRPLPSIVFGAVTSKRSFHLSQEHLRQRGGGGGGGRLLLRLQLLPLDFQQPLNLNFTRVT